MVGCGHYRIEGDNLLRKYQEIILMVGIVGFVVKIVKKKLEVDNPFLQCSDALVSFTFIELFDSSVGEDLTPLPSLTKSSKLIFQSGTFLLSKPSTPMGSIQSIVFCLCVMVLLGQTSNELRTLDYDNILLQKVQFLLIAFDGDVLFKLPPIHLNVQNPSQMQSMDKKYDGHAWCKLVTTNIKNSFRFSFKKARCLGRLHYVQDDRENFVCFNIRNETF